ncbi:MAG TPA: thiol:disulfide interchange protein DsbA/DsbL [Gammaproteobacteria bacterium]|nr:thiol:disulfide interchange protein DsbA/DsbL [Gammaproteobacteria bacterium]
MKTLVIGLLCLFMFSVQARADYTEGVEYSRISPPVSTSVPPGKVEVVEVFWYGCPHCYDLEPMLEKWVHSEKPKAAVFVRVPAALNPSWLVHAQTYCGLQVMGKVNQVHEAIFQAIHEQGRLLSDVDSMARFLAQQGIDPKAFKKAYHSMEAQTCLQHNAELNRRYGVTGVPSMVVAGKYLTSASQAGSYENMLKVVDYLVAKEAGKKQENKNMSGEGRARIMQRHFSNR